MKISFLFKKLCEINLILRGNMGNVGTSHFRPDHFMLVIIAKQLEQKITEALASSDQECNIDGLMPVTIEFLRMQEESAARQE